MKVMKHCADCKYSRNVGSYLACYGKINAPKVNWFDVCEDWKPKRITNADRIRSMTDEELANLINRIEPKLCHDGWDYMIGCDEDKDCVMCWLDWLRQEADDGE